MIDFSEIEPYYGPLAVEDLDAAVAAVQNADSAPDATHTDNLITSAAVANALYGYATKEDCDIRHHAIGTSSTMTIKISGTCAILLSSNSIYPTGNGLWYISGTTYQNGGFAVNQLVAASGLTISNSTADSVCTITVTSSYNRTTQFCLLVLARGTTGLTITIT